MKPALALLSALPLIAAAPASAADLSGVWRVTCQVETFGFVLECKFNQEGQTLGGVCTDLSTNDPGHKPQGSHVLTTGKVEGDKVSFAYKTHFLLIPFTAAYSGTLNGDRITGEALAPGHKGSFTAVRN